MAKFVIGLVVGLAWIALIGAVIWFGGPKIWAHFQAAEAAVHTVQVQQNALQADTASANRKQVDCTAEIKASVKAGAAIAKLSQPVTNAAGEQKLITADQIEDAIQ